jgi:hypothetical protein
MAIYVNSAWEGKTGEVKVGKEKLTMKTDAFASVADALNAVMADDVAKINAVRERYPAEWKKVLELRQQNKHGEARALTRELIRRLETPGKTAPQQPAGK